MSDPDADGLAQKMASKFDQNADIFAQKNGELRSKRLTGWGGWARSPILMRTFHPQNTQYLAQILPPKGCTAVPRKISSQPSVFARLDTEMRPLMSEGPILSADGQRKKLTYPITMRTYLLAKVMYGNGQNPQKWIGHVTAYAEGLSQHRILSKHFDVQGER